MLLRRMSATTRGGKQNKFYPRSIKHRGKESFIGNMLLLWCKGSEQMNDK